MFITTIKMAVHGKSTDDFVSRILTLKTVYFDGLFFNLKIYELYTKRTWHNPKSQENLITTRNIPKFPEKHRRFIFSVI